MRKIYLLILCSFLYSSQGQVVNIESLRSFVDTTGFHGAENLNVDYRRNTRELLVLTNNLSLKYQNKRHTFLLLNTIDVQLANSEVLEQTSFVHFRYNLMQGKRLYYEVFWQYQRNIPLKIDPRILVGLGPRFIISKSEKLRTNLGLLGMFEYDNEAGNDILHRDFRLSAYFTLGYKGGDRFSWMNFIYYQPRLDYFNDYRINLETQMQWVIFKRLSFVTTLNFKYDSFPVKDANIPNLTAIWVSGLAYQF
jgi:hypothetical protein